MFDLSKKFTLPDTLLKSKKYCIDNQNVLILIQNSWQSQMKPSGPVKNF